MGWIDSKEALPDPGTLCLVWVNGQPELATYEGDGRWYDTLECYIEETPGVEFWIEITPPC